MSGWGLVAALAVADAFLWVCVIPPPAPRVLERLQRYCRAPLMPAGVDRPGTSRSAEAARRGRPRASDLRALKNALPDALDTLAVCLRAGLGLHAAVAEYAKTATGVAGDAFRGYLADLGMGRPPDEALEELARRYPLDEVAAAAAAVAQSLRVGAPLAEILEGQAAHCRAVTLQRARESAQRLSTQLVLPLVAFIFPVVFIIGLGPVALKVARLVGLIR